MAARTADASGARDDVVEALLPGAASPLVRRDAEHREVGVEVIDKPGIRAFAEAAMREHTPPEQRRLLGRIEAALGVLPRGADPERVMLELLEDGVTGVYDPKRKALFIGDFVRPSAGARRRTARVRIGSWRWLRRSVGQTLLERWRAAL